MLDNSKKEKILKSSLEEFSEHGYEKASTDRICERAGVSKGLIFHHFGSKDNLYMITMNNCINDILQEFDGLDTTDMDFMSIIKKTMKFKYEFFKKNPMHYKMMVTGFYNTPKKLRGELEKKYGELKQTGMGIVVDMLRNMPIKKNVSAADAASMISAITNIIESKYMYYFTDEMASFDEFIDAANEEYIRLLNIVLYGILD